MPTFVSVVIPVYNDADGLRDTLQSLIVQDCLDKDYEIIVADNGSTDQTTEVANDFRRRYPGLIKVVVEADVQSSYAARNKGVRIAKGGILCFVDADMTVEPDYVWRVRERFAKGSIDYLGCRVEMTLPRDTLAARFNGIRGFNNQASMKKHNYAPTCALAVRREVFDAVGHFDGRLESGGDYEFGQRVAASGFSMGYASDIVMHHPARWRYASLLSKSRRVSRGVAQLTHYYPGKFQHLYDRHFLIREFLPNNPFTWRRQLMAAGMPVGWISAVILSFYQVPLKIVGLICVLHETNRLRATHNGQ